MKKLFLLLILLFLLPMLACQLSEGNGGQSIPGTPGALELPTALPENSTSEPPTTAATEVSEDTTDGAIAEETPPSPTTNPTNSDPDAPTPTLCATMGEWPSYMVEPGDTLFSIAQRADSSVDELIAANCLTTRDQIPVGLRLFVPRDITIATPFPTTMSGFDNLVIYSPNQCMAAPFSRSAGVSVGERWRVSRGLEVLTMFDADTSNDPVTLLYTEEILDVIDGPVCFTKTHGGSQVDFRRWQVTSAERNITGWIDEYDPYTEAHTIQPDYEVVKFRVYPEVINSGDPITIEWQVSGADEAHIYSYHSLHRFASNRVSDERLPPAGSITVYAPPSLTSIQYSIGFGPEDPDHWATVTINCSQEFFADPGDVNSCPETPVETVQAVYQSFEHGYMLWRTDMAANTIWVMMEESPASHIFTDNWDGEEIPFDQNPPDGLFQPQRGFNKVWVENDWVRSGLGWATTPEFSYVMELQKSQTGYASYVHFFSLPDGRLVKATQSMGSVVSWQYTTRQ